MRAQTVSAVSRSVVVSVLRSRATIPQATRGMVQVPQATC